MSTYIEHEAAFAEIGYRPSSAAICPRVVAGKRCSIGYDLRRLSIGSHICVCWRFAHVLDHGRMWIDRDSTHVLTSEPYDFCDDEITSYLSELRVLGLEAHFTGHARWHPTAILITVTPDGYRRPALRVKP